MGLPVPVYQGEDDQNKTNMLAVIAAWRRQAERIQRDLQDLLDDLAAKEEALKQKGC